ncbi:hypothetical protein SAMN05192533_103322 [Mesobacillus persicus]|uniref:NPH3 family protein n=1 Tax=Mesobacillus persicus TaxID=930146 RepID=A0A1H7ZBV6_9BACI|nr:hypothetical protein [Mesobacillus persicus]SEM54987.1 hypothetical protein SAMN05192533_103322 [Mesobacillus persicus]
MLEKEILLELERYIHSYQNEMICKSSEMNMDSDFNILENVQHSELKDFIDANRKPTLSQVLFGFIDQKGYRDADVYKRAGMDRKHFSKIRSIPNYRPRKNTVIALALALELDYDNTDELLSAAGYSLSESDTYDLVIQFCLEKRIYDLDSVNQALDYFSLKPLT